MKKSVSILVDTVLIFAFFALIFTLFNGEVRWKTSFIKLKLSGCGKPFLVLLILFFVKTIFNFNVGVFAYFEKREITFLSPLSCYIHNFACKLRRIASVNKGNLILCGVTILISLVLLEFYFRYFPETLPRAMGNAIASGYNTNLTGIYRYNPELHADLIRPNYKRDMFFNRYKWSHEADSMGFRNPTNRESGEIVLLGDSMIYGHGVDETATVRHHLEELKERTVINLGISRTSIHQQYQVLKAFGVQLKPEYVFQFFLYNDIQELVVHFTDEDFTRFMEIPVDDHTTPYFMVKHKHFRPKFYLRALYVYNAYDLLKDYLKQFKLNKLWPFQLEEANASNNSWYSLPFFQDKPRYVHAMHFHLKALLKIKDIAQKNNFNFINVFIYTGSYEGQIYENIISDFCKSNDISFLNLRDYFVPEIENGKNLFLKNDGHFTDEGAALTAKVVADYINTFENP
jgi:lysophospholipase L1-like esterase